MKALLLAVVLAMFAQQASTSFQAQTTDERVAGVKLNWLEKRYRRMSQESVATAEKRVKEAQDKLVRLTSAPEYPDQQKEISSQRDDIANHQKELDAARDQLNKTDELLTKVVADKAMRKQFNKELRAALEAENRQTAAENSTYRSPYPHSPSTFIVRCYSGGFGGYFWVRCASSWY